MKRVFKTWILIPIAYFGNIWGSPTYDIMSNKLFTKNGTSYPFQTLRESIISTLDVPFTHNLKVYTDSSGSQQVNETRYEEVGLSYAGAQFTWGIFMVCLAAHLRHANSLANTGPYLVVCVVYLIVCVGRAVSCTETSAIVEE